MDDEPLTDPGPPGKPLALLPDSDWLGKPLDEWDCPEKLGPDGTPECDWLPECDEPPGRPPAMPLDWLPGKLDVVLPKLGPLGTVGAELE